MKMKKIMVLLLALVLLALMLPLSASAANTRDEQYKFTWSGSQRISCSGYRQKADDSRVYFRTQNGTLPVKGYRMSSYIMSLGIESNRYMITDYRGYALNHMASSRAAGRSVQLEAYYPESHYSWGDVTVWWSPDYYPDGSTYLG